MKNTIKPKELQKGDVVGIVSPTGPILEISDLGHNVENYIFPIGAEVKMDADRKEIIINENKQ